MFVSLAILWGGSFVAIEVGLHYFPPLVFAGGRYAVAGAVVLGYAAMATDRWRPRARGEYLAVTVVAALVIAAYHGLLYLGEQRISGAVAAVVVSLSPVLTAGFAALLLDERLTLPKAVGFALGVSGVAVVAGFTPASMLSASGIGVGLVLLGGACFALGAVLTRPLRTDLSAAALEGWAMLVGAGLLFAGGALRGESLSAVHLTPTAVASFVYLTLLSGVVAFLLYFRLLDRIGPTRLNLVGYLEPVVATLASWALLGEVVSPSTAVGFAAVFAGFAVLNRNAVRTAVTTVRSSSLASSVRSMDAGSLVRSGAEAVRSSAETIRSRARTGRSPNSSVVTRTGSKTVRSGVATARSALGREENTNRRSDGDGHSVGNERSTSNERSAADAAERSGSWSGSTGLADD